MKNEATIMMHVIGNETDKEILEVVKPIIELSKHMDINLKIVRVKPVEYTKKDEPGIVFIEDPNSASSTRDILDNIALTGTITNKHVDGLDAHLYSQYIVDQIRG